MPEQYDAIEINYRLKKLGYSQKDIAGAISVTQAVVSNTINNRISCSSVAFHIAELLNIPAKDLWPGRYVYRPRPLRRTHKPDNSVAAYPEDAS